MGAESDLVVPGTIAYVVQVVTDMASTVSGHGLRVLVLVLPVMAVVVAALVVAKLGVRLVRRFAR